MLTFNIMNLLQIFILISLFCQQGESSRKISTFWHISGVYWSSYQNNCPKRQSSCIFESLSKLLDKSGELQPDFILWSSAREPYRSTLTEELKRFVGDVLVFPALPPQKLPATNTSLLYYQRLAHPFVEGGLDEGAQTTFWKAGYYSQRISDNLQLIALNSALFCTFHVASQSDDPADQWRWLNTELTNARKAKWKVYLLLSATPGVTDSYKNRMFAPKHNHKYMRMIRTFSDVILGQFGGYEEGDKFHVFYNEKEQPLNWMLLSPPLHKCARLYLYDFEMCYPLDYVQFCRENKTWETHYRFSNYYKVPNISAISLDLLARQLQNDEETFAKYILTNKYISDFPKYLSFTDMYKKEVCNDNYCPKTPVCNAMAVDYGSYLECTAQQSWPYLSMTTTNKGINSIITLFSISTSFFMNKILFDKI